MVEIAGASDLISGGEPPAMTPEQAFARRVELQHDPEFQERLKRDSNARDELARVTRAITERNTFVNVGDESEVAASELLDREARIEAFSKHADLPPEVKQQIRENRPISREERRLADAERQRLMKDREWVKSYMEGSRAARTKMALLSVVLGSPIKD